MLAERELVALLYRADWTRLCLSGEVSGRDEPSLTVITRMRAGHRGTDGPFPPFPSQFTAPRSDLTRLLLAPGRRYRKDSQDGQVAQGCDGEHVWQWWRYPPPGEVRLVGGPEPPFPALLCPSWLLAGYDLEVGEAVSACGRDGIRVVATARRSMARTRTPPFLPFSPWPPVHFDHVEAIIDAGLGILLQCERRKADRAAEVMKFRSLAVDPAHDPEQFTAPAGSIVGEGYGRLFGRSFSGVGWEIAKTTAGLAAGGLGATIRYSPFGPFGPLRPSGPSPGDNDAESAMPRDDPPPGDAADGPPVSDELLHLLYRGSATAPAFTATLHQWFDAGALLAAVPSSARQAGFGGVGFLIDTLSAAARDAGEQQAVGHVASNVAIDGWESYRIDCTYRTPGRRDRHERRDAEWVTVACDGQRRYQVYADRVCIGPSAPPPAELTDLADGSWLLRCHLSGGNQIMVGGRRAYRIAVSRPASPLMLFFFPAIAVLDADSGRLLRLTCYSAGKPAARYELRDITSGGSIDVRFEVPPGLPVVDESSGHDRPPPPPPVNLVTSAAKAAADAIKRRADDKVAAARSLYDALRAAYSPRR